MKPNRSRVDREHRKIIFYFVRGRNLAHEVIHDQKATVEPNDQHGMLNCQALTPNDDDVKIGRIQSQVDQQPHFKDSEILTITSRAMHRLHGTSPVIESAVIIDIAAISYTYIHFGIHLAQFFQI